MNFVFQGRVQPRPILIVDDSPCIHKVFARIFRAEDTSSEGSFRDLTSDSAFDVTFAICGEQATHILEKRVHCGRPFALAFVDMSMPPGWNGIETIEQLLHLQPDLEIAVCSGSVDYSWHEVVRRFGAHIRLLRKPFSTGEVLSTAFELTNRWWQRTHPEVISKIPLTG